MTHQSEPDMLVLHAVRLVGFADSGEVAKLAGTSHAEALRVLTESERAGWVQHDAFADLDGWSLTESGKVENERQLAAERVVADPNGMVAADYLNFLPLNARLLRAVTDWQIKATDADQFSPNDHTDLVWNERVFDELAALGRELAPLIERLTEVLSRFDGYTSRFDAALAKARAGWQDWVDKSSVDSCHRVWFQLHEDLIATLGVDRSSEGPTGFE